ncbi:MAG: ABC transporter permease [Nanoarchaeota archaeon]
MKLLAIIEKNIKMLFRSKGTAVMTIIGPLLIILLVGLAFNNTKSSEFYAGVYAPEYTKLTETFIENLENDNFNVQKLTSEVACVQKIEEGLIHTCIIFPEHFRIENGRTNEITIYIDNSRINIVYQVVSSLSRNLELKSEELSLGMTNLLLQTLFTTKDSMTADLLTIVNMKKKTDDLYQANAEIISSMNTIAFDDAHLDLSAIKSTGQEIQYSAKEIKDKGLMIVDFAETFAAEVEQNTSFDISNFTQELTALKEELNTLYNLTPQKLNTLTNRLEDTEKELSTINEQIAYSRTTITTLVTKLNELKNDIDTLKTDLTNLKTSLDNSIAKIGSVEVTSAQSIVSPVTTTIKPVASQASKLLFLFPGLLMLVVLFIGLFLAGTLIIMEKTSKASFRNFTTPTKEEKFIAAHYLTTTLLVLLQAILIIALAFIFLKSPLFHNFAITFFTLLLAITLFVLLGILIGNLFSTQEGVMMVSMSIGTVLLLLSNLIFPLEDISGFLSGIVQFNPYVIATELLKKSLLFDITFKEIFFPLFLLLLYSVIILAFVILTKNFTRNKSMISRAFIHYHPPDASLTLSHGKTVRTILELSSALKEMTEPEFIEHVTGAKSDFSIWLRSIDLHLSKKIEGKGRPEMIKILDGHLHSQEQKRPFFAIKRKD